MTTKLEHLTLRLLDILNGEGYVEETHQIFPLVSINCHTKQLKDSLDSILAELKIESNWEPSEKYKVNYIIRK